jgi:hypothetical protein
MADRRDRDRYDRPSWKEIDKRKDRSAHTGEGPANRKLDERKVTTGYHRYRQDLDSLFDTGEASRMVRKVMDKAPGREVSAQGSGQVPERQRLLRAIRDATSTSEIARLLDEFLASWELPDDIDVLTQALDHPDEQVQLDALARISSYLDGHVPDRTGLMRSRLRKLSRSDEDEVASLARAVSRKLPL